MKKRIIKIKSFDIDHENGKTFVIWHEWDGVYFCAKCALDPKNGWIDGSFWNSVDEVKNKVLQQHYGHN